MQRQNKLLLDKGRMDFRNAIFIELNICLC
uniref:Uncharacterized protein n=1 Tax=viral metagenome TaxID=1070528 RepID=A0A6C0DCI4_9ZZZZ